MLPPLPLLLHNNSARMWLDGQLSRPSRRWSWPHPAEPLMMCTMVDDCDCAIADAPSPPRRSAVSWLKWDGWMGRLDTWLAGWLGGWRAGWATLLGWLAWLTHRVQVAGCISRLTNGNGSSATTLRWLIVFPCKSGDKLINANDTFRPKTSCHLQVSSRCQRKRKQQQQQTQQRERKMPRDDPTWLRNKQIAF